MTPGEGARALHASPCTPRAPCRFPRDTPRMRPTRSIAADAGIKDLVRYYLLESDSKLGQAIDIFLLILNLLACVMFVMLVEGYSQIQWLDITIGVVFTIEYGVRVWVEEPWSTYVFSFYGFVDLMTAIPWVIELSAGGAVQHVRVIQVFRVVRVLRFARFLDTEEFFFGTLSALHLQAMRIVFTVLSLIFCASGMFVVIEGKHTSAQTVESFGECVYYIIITFSTVGYGDITPKTDMGRFVMSLFILGTMIFVPMQVRELIRLNPDELPGRSEADKFKCYEMFLQLCTRYPEFARLRTRFEAGEFGALRDFLRAAEAAQGIAGGGDEGDSKQGDGESKQTQPLEVTAR